MSILRDIFIKPEPIQYAPQSNYIPGTEQNPFPGLERELAGMNFSLPPREKRLSIQEEYEEQQEIEQEVRRANFKKEMEEFDIHIKETINKIEKEIHNKYTTSKPLENRYESSENKERMYQEDYQAFIKRQKYRNSKKN